MNVIKDATAARQERELKAYYQAKFPDRIGQADAQAPEQKLTPEERQNQNQAFSDGVFKANQSANADAMARLENEFKARNRGMK